MAHSSNSAPARFLRLELTKANGSKDSSRKAAMPEHISKLILRRGMRQTLAAKVSTDKAKHVDKVIAAQFELVSNSLYMY